MKFYLILLSIFFALVLGEGILRVLDINYLNFYQYDESVGYGLISNFEGTYKGEGSSELKINSHGMRDSEHELPKPPGVFRVAVLGDSFVEAVQLSFEKSFSYLLEQKLNPCLEQKVETLNFGVGGYGTAEELLTLKNKVWKFDPDLILLVFTTGNDVLDNTRPISVKLLRPTDFKERSFLYRSFRKSVEKLGSQSYLVALSLHALKNWRAALTPASPSHYLEESGIKDEVYRMPQDEFWKEAWNSTEALLQMLKEEVDQHHKKLFIVTGSTAPQVFPDKNLRREFMEKKNISNLFYPDQIIKQWGEKFKVPVLSLAPVMQKKADKDSIFYHGFDPKKLGKGHWNETGHSMAANLTTDFLLGANLFGFQKRDCRKTPSDR